MATISLIQETSDVERCIGWRARLVSEIRHREMKWQDQDWVVRLQILSMVGDEQWSI
jgi:hypothetical protein